MSEDDSAFDDVDEFDEEDWSWTCGEVDPCSGCSPGCQCGDCSMCLTPEEEAELAVDMGYAGSADSMTLLQKRAVDDASRGGGAVANKVIGGETATGERSADAAQRTFKPIQTVLVGGYPKGYGEPFSEETLSGKRLHRILREINFEPWMIDLWKSANEENAMDLAHDKVQYFAYYLSGDFEREFRIVALGRWVAKALTRAATRFPFLDRAMKEGRVRYLPHPASRRASDLQKLRRGLVAAAKLERSFSDDA